MIDFLSPDYFKRNGAIDKLVSDIKITEHEN